MTIKCFENPIQSIWQWQWQFHAISLSLLFSSSLTLFYRQVLYMHTLAHNAWQMYARSFCFPEFVCFGSICSRQNWKHITSREHTIRTWFFYLSMFQYASQATASTLLMFVFPIFTWKHFDVEHQKWMNMYRKFTDNSPKALFSISFVLRHTFQWPIKCTHISRLVYIDLCQFDHLECVWFDTHYHGSHY